MSDNEDLLSYEIGDIDVHDDDGDDLDAVEDELLMSDDEPTLDDEITANTTQAKKEVAGRLSKNDRQIVSPPAVTDSSNKSTTKKRTLKRNVCTTVNSQIPPKQAKQVTDEQSSQNEKQESQSHGGSDLGQEIPQNSQDTLPARLTAEAVTPTKSNKNADACSLSDLESPVASLIFSQSGDTTTPTTTVTSQDESLSCVDESESESVSLTQRSQDTVSAQNSHEESAVADDLESDYNRHKVDTELEDSDDCTERTNARLCVERDVGSQDSQVNQVRHPFYKNQRGGVSPRNNIGPRPPQNFPPQFNAFAQRPNNMQFNPRYGPPPMIAPPQNHQSGQRMDFRGITPLNFRPPYQNNMQRPGNRLHFTQHGQAVSRPNFMQNGPTNGPPFPPYNQQNPQQIMGHFEQNGPMMYPSRPPFRCPTAPQYPGPPRHETAPPHIAPPGLPAIVPRKVLINPNFKGGVQAATNQLMMDTLGNPQYMSAQSDAELLRQQEAFINKNRMHIEKRRYERSPDRDRERDRSYSPPRRERRYSREREIRKPMQNRGGRNQRAGSRDRPFTKRRRSSSLERDKLNKVDDKPNEPEDEETKKYRLEIEKQKSMREKILRDKEMRRRQAAEEKTKDDEKKPADEPATTKLTPIIVTEKKIISLKKKTETNPVVQRTTSSSTKPEAARKTDSQSSAPSIATKSVRPVLRLQTANQRLSDLEDYDEDELLADSPTPPPNPTPSTNVTGTMFTNRRVVLTSSSTTADTVVKPKMLLTKNATAKGIFDRLDAKIGINEAAKRKIQKIVIKSND
ncbi:uncharacterized protein LOC119084315 [Bradysia coprophila]|uniref:uncharacterized protein LOC119084315 n=1 Tax=Bradysia coprophila TaxID=38358 RepID=UPI00187D7207|nr:uncharacterized protein LOC119084315 [Bradysia coprophila]XP_037050131.1 uncharacterized protein LOC119084315 [Bradysia coprophila]XP_037050132.1 uncharacterized protein LOC119084315 [Bradysia coprophila]XP_037050133.1 uncharacterized protein LOC119084315 [Bradysia coprophila]XP_037050134.1 uncharacterized protein LOC119084315 [Bradysia coprophila]